MSYLRAATVALTTLAVVGWPVVPAGAAPYDAGLSEPREDSYYPAHGDPGVDVLHYGLDLDWRREARTLVGTATLDVRLPRATSVIRLDLLKALEVDEATVDGQPVTVDRPGNHVVLELPAEAPADSRHVVVIDYHGTPHRIPAPSTRYDMANGLGMQVTKRGQLRTMQEPFGASTWYPVNDHPSDKALYDITVEVPPGWTGVANGTPTELPPNGDRPVTSWHLRDPAASYLVTLAVGPYQLKEMEGPRGLPIRLYAPTRRADAWFELLRKLPADLRWLEARLGRYPFESVGAVIVPGGSAMETQTMVTFGAALYGPVARRIMVHELVHQWYGDTVTPDDWTGLWLNEGMAIYLEGRWAVDHMNDTWRSWARYFAQANRNLRPDEGPPAAYKKRRFAEGCVYYCTAAMFETLRKKIGNREFWGLVERWPQAHRNENADRKKFVRFVEARTGRELSGFFRRWLYAESWD